MKISLLTKEEQKELLIENFSGMGSIFQKETILRSFFFDRKILELNKKLIREVKKLCSCKILKFKNNILGSILDCEHTGKKYYEKSNVFFSLFRKNRKDLLYFQ